MVRSDLSFGLGSSALGLDSSFLFAVDCGSSIGVVSSGVGSSTSLGVLGREASYDSGYQAGFSSSKNASTFCYQADL